MSWKDWIPKLTWKKDEVIREENENLLALCDEMNSINKGLNQAVGLLHEQALTIKAEALSVLTALAFQHNGSITIKSEFFAIIDDPNNANLNLNVEKQTDGSVVVKLVSVQEEEKDASE